MKTFEVGQKIWIYRRADVDLDEGTVSSVSPSGAVVGVTLANGSVQRFHAREHFCLYGSMKAQEYNRALEMTRARGKAREAFNAAVTRLIMLADGWGRSTPDAIERLQRATALLDDVTTAMGKPEGSR